MMFRDCWLTGVLCILEISLRTARRRGGSQSSVWTGCAICLKDSILASRRASDLASRSELLPWGMASAVAVCSRGRECSLSVSE